MKTMTAKKKLSAALGVTLAAALLCTAAAFAADSYESGKESHTVNGITYQTYSIVYPALNRAHPHGCIPRTMPRCRWAIWD